MANPSYVPGNVARAEEAWNKTFLGYVPYIGIGFLLAYTLPVSNYGSSAFSSLVDITTSIVPSIDRLARLSFAPEFTRTFGALMWLMQPVFTVLALIRSPRVPVRRLPWSSLIAMPLGVIVLVLLGILFPFFFLDTSPDDLVYSRGRGVAGVKFILESRFGHASLGSVMFAFSSISQVFVWRFLRDCPRLIAHNIQIRFGRRETND